MMNDRQEKHPEAETRFFLRASQRVFESNSEQKKFLVSSWHRDLMNFLC